MPPRENVTFKINDIKALVTLSYTTGLEATLISRRCDHRAKDIKLDMYGNPLDMSCIDTNPGTFHIAMANILGLRKQAFLEDRRWDSEVWNHPIYSFNISMERDLTSDQANETIGVLGEVISTDKNSGSLKEHEWSPAWAHDTSGADGVAVSLTGDMDVDLYVKFDSEPNGSNYNCRSTSSTPNETCILKIPSNARRVFIKVYEFAGKGNYTSTLRFTKKRSETYTMNPRAVSFKYMVANVSSVGESDATVDGNLSSLVAGYTLSDTYEYILEIDAAGKVVGGEWLNGSRYNHPDFLWLPTRKLDRTVAGIEWEKVKMLLARSRGSQEVPPLCLVRNGRGEGDIFDCKYNDIMMKCAKTDRSYSVICLSQMPSS